MQTLGINLIKPGEALLVRVELLLWQPLASNQFSMHLRFVSSKIHLSQNPLTTLSRSFRESEANDPQETKFGMHSA